MQHAHMHTFILMLFDDILPCTTEYMYQMCNCITSATLYSRFSESSRAWTLVEMAVYSGRFRNFEMGFQF